MRKGDGIDVELGVPCDDLQRAPRSRLRVEGAPRMHAEADGERYSSSGPMAADGAFEVAFRGRRPMTLAAGFRREAVEDTLVSTEGADIGGEFVGQVRSNLAYASVGYTSIRSHVDATAKVSGGAYTGHGLDANRRWGVSGSVGVTLRGFRPYVRVAYAVDYLSFAFDASAQPLAPGQRRAGGYFSPTRFLTNFAIGHVAYQFRHDRGEVFADASVGAQNVETIYGRFGDVGFAGTLATGVVWRPGSMNEIRVEYRYLNVFNAFRRNTAAIAFRRRPTPPAAPWTTAHTTTNPRRPRPKSRAAASASGSSARRGV